MTRSPLDPLSAATPDSRAANALETVDLLAYYGRELSLTLQSAGIFDLTLEGAMALTGAPAALLCAREASGDGWRALRARGLDPRLLPAICRAVPGDFGGKASTLTFVMVAGKPVPVATWYDLRMLLPPDVVPLLSTDRIDRVVSLALEHDGPALLQLFAPNDRVPSPDSLAAVRILLGQTSVALRNARLYFEGSRWAERMAKLQMAGTAIGGTLHVKTVLAAAVRHACDLVEAPAGVLALWNTQTRLLTVQTGQRMAALDTGGTTAHLGEGLAGRAAQERRALARDYAPAAEADASPGAGDPLGAVAAIPLLWQDDLLGVLQVADGNANRVFSDDDLSLLMLLGQQTASAIANARLYERSQARLHQLTVLQDTSRAIIAQLDYDQILRTVLRNVGNLLGTTMGAVFVPNEHEGDLTPRVVVGLQASQLPASATPREDGGLGRVMLAAKPVAVYDALADPSLAPPGEMPPPFRSLLAVPLISQGRVLGALCVYADAPRHWSPAEAELLLVFASQAGNAVQNVLLVDRLRAEKATLATTIESMG
ncbi:MAG TPA: GAF domain-containing protein, partial [Chloroflexia bacterium]|nr:GAF domain-containing protein [Chloroflexia bacterium]